jgi:hypothetical protein
MRTKALLLLLLLLLPLAPAVAHDSDLIETKVKLSLARLADAIASEGAVPNHAARLALAQDLLNNLDQHTRKFVPRILQAYPTSRNVCHADSLTNAVNCSNPATENEVYNQVIALFGNLLLLSEAQASLEFLDVGAPVLARQKTEPADVIATRKP